MEHESGPDLGEFEAELGHRFANADLLRTALTHSSCRNDLNCTNERLEFLGDAVLGFIVSECLFQDFPGHTEGQLTRVKSVVVSRATLGKVARDLRFQDFLIIGKGLAQRRAVPASLLANAFEAVLAAIYLDAGMDAARAFVRKCLDEPIQRVLENRHDLNYKSILQQYAQRELGVTPTYRVTGEQGPDHGKSFTVLAVLAGREHGTGTGLTKKEAEQTAAAEALRSLGVDMSSSLAFEEPRLDEAPAPERDRREPPELTPEDARILSFVQVKFPLAVDPYAELAAALDVDPRHALRRVRRLRRSKAIRRIGAVIETQALGLARTLVALRVPEDQVDQVAPVVNAIPGVTHNYLREADYNMWFTLCARDEGELAEELARVAQTPGVEAAISLPAVQSFKVEVLFDFGYPRPDSAPPRPQPAVPLTELQRRLLGRIQFDLPHGPHPYRDLAAELDLDETDLIREIAGLVEAGWVRRFAAVLSHRRLGFTANAMSVWIAPADRVEDAGRRMAEFPEVTHCYQRRPAPDWPYNLYAMLHARARPACEDSARRISEAVGLAEYRLLFSTHELKKTSLRFPWTD